MTDLSKYTIGWICAIDTEYTAAQAFLDETHEPPEAIPVHDHNAYTLGRAGKHDVVIAVLPDGEYGLSTAGVVAQRMLDSFPNVRLGLMVGIGGGAPSQRPGHDIRLGDVVVSSPRDGHSGVLQYDFGKTIQNQEFKLTRTLNLPPNILRTAVSKLRSTFEIKGSDIPEAIETALSKKPRLRRKYGRPPQETDVLLLSHVVYDPRRPIEAPEPDLLVPRLDPAEPDLGSCSGKAGDLGRALARYTRQERDEDDDNPAIFYGLIASANQLMKDAEVRDKFAAQKDVLCFEMEAAGLMNHFPCLVVRGICDYSDSHKNNRWKGYAAMAAAASAKALLNQVPPQKVELERRLVDVVEDQLRRIAEQVSRVDHSITYDAIKRLAASNGAMYDSVENRHKPMCLENTRVDLLQDIMQWARKVNDQRIYWLNGMAGTGKSTISRTIASRCNARGILGASFFFSRGESGRNDASLFFGTIAVQLAKVRTNLQPHIIASINETDNITSKGIHEQFRMLVLRPLQQTSTVSRDSTHMIVIDALDECADEKDAEVIVSLLSDIAKEKSFGLKVFITSRPEIATSYAFDPVLGHVQEIILQEVTKHVIDSDIGTFLDHELSKIRNRWNLRHHNNSSARIPEDWPGKETLGILVKHATSLFIFAATVCRFVDDYRFGSPREQLAYMMRTISKGRMTSNMDATYLPVLFKLKDNENAPNLKDHNLVSSFQHVIGTIILLEEPLSIESIAYLTNSKAAEVHRMTYLLKSVLEMSEEPGSPIKLFHLSFRDFLISPSAGEFKIDIKYRHDQMAFSCINLLSTKKHLRYNICGLKPGDARPKLGSQSVQKELPPPVKYACSHLIDHLEQADIILKDGDAFHLFVEVHFLHWIEALILLGEASKVVSIPERLLRPRRTASKIFGRC
ncbi:Vegetative incompatibility protein HET-E-1 [Colletotrichum fructicola]|nr:Vegetative incompatibility protein HET-E-1 [Colletotrichum fructicola]KAF4933709.1 Vegetative incompatibility protein HET-E-1 [Colletotrichum fructicola]